MAYYPLASATKKEESRNKVGGFEQETLFRLGRLCGTIVLGVLVLARPELGTHSQAVGLLLILGWAPLGLLLDLWATPTHRLPVQTCVDLLAVVVCCALLPQLWVTGAVLGALIVGGSVPRFVSSFKLTGMVVPVAFLSAMAGIAWHFQITDTLVPLLAMTFGVPFCFLYALKDLRREQELRDRINVMDSLTRIAGGIGHDFNNILTGIQGNAELAEQKLDRNHVARPYLQALLAESQKAQLFSSQLVAFSGGVVTGSARLDLRAELYGIASLLESALPRGLHLKITTQPNLPLVSGNRAQLQEIMVSSVLRVADAFDHRPGEVEVALRKVERRHAEELVIRVRTNANSVLGNTLESTLGKARPNQQASASNRSSVAAARHVLREHGGDMEMHGDWRSGLVVTLRLPALPATQSSAPRPGVPEPMVPRHVLMLEAVPGVRAVGQSLLQELGHRVSCALTEADAVDILETDPSVEIVLLDTGVADSHVLLDRIYACRPDLPVLVPDLGVLDDPEQSLNYVAKPYSTAGLNSAIARAFAAQRARQNNRG